jgi:O-antigen/teichoic acid export membrane protein
MGERLRSEGTGLRSMLDAARRYGFGLTARGLEVLAKFGLYALGARVLGPVEAGVFFLCLSLLHLLSTAARLGTERPLSRYIASYAASGELEEARAAARHGLAIAAVAGTLAGGLLWAGAPLLAERLFREPAAAEAFRLLACAAPGHVLAYACGNVLIGLNRAGAAQFLTNALAPGATFLALLAGAGDIDLVLTVYGAAYWSCFVAALVLAVRRFRQVGTGLDPDAARDRPKLPPLLTAARAFYVVELTQAALISAPVLVLARFAEPAQVSEFSVANRLSMLVATIVLSLATATAPRLAAHHRLEQYGEIGVALRQVTLLSLAVCLPVIALMGLLRQPLLQLMGTPTTEAGAALLWMLGAQLAVAALPARDTTLAMTGHGAALRNLSLAQVGVSALGCLLLIPSFGVLGAAWVSALTWLFGVLGCEVLVRRELAGAIRPVT